MELFTRRKIEKFCGVIINGRVYEAVEDFSNGNCTKCSMGTPPHPKCTAECCTFTSCYLRYSQELTDKITTTLNLTEDDV